MKSLETLICAGVTALTLACGGGNGSSSSSGSTVPGCTSHNDCRGDRMCVEGECKDYEQGCPVDYTFRCDEESKFQGRFSPIKSSCPLVFGDYSANYLGFESPYNCNTVDGAGVMQDGTVFCLYNRNNANINYTGNYFLISGDLSVPDSDGPLEWIKCNKDLIYFRWKNRNCSTLLTKETDEFQAHSGFVCSH